MVVIPAEVRQVALAIQHQRPIHRERPCASLDHARTIGADAPVGICLADQLLPILALGQGGTFRTLSLSQHARTNAEIVQLFRDVTIEIIEHGRDDVEVHVTTN